VRRVYLSAYEDKVFFLASALAFDALVAILPFGMLLLAIFGHLVYAAADSVGGIQNVLDFALPRGNPELRATAERFLAGLAERRETLSLVGLPLFLWFSTRFYSSARAALNDVFDTEESRPWLLGKGIDLALVLVSLALLLMNGFATVRLTAYPWLGRLVGQLGAFGAMLVLFFLVHKLAPSRRVSWDMALVGSVVAGVAFEVAKGLYGLYLMRFATLDRLFSGSNAVAVVLLVVWVYYTACAFLIGGEVAETYDLMKRQRQQRAVLV
jgi:membrane protein